MISKQVFINAAIQAMAWIAGPAAFAQQPFTIHGQLAKDRQGMVRLVYYNDAGDGIKDSAAVKDGAFVLKGTIANPGPAQLILNPDDGRPMTAEYYKSLDQQIFYLEGAEYSLKSDSGIKASLIRGGQAQSDYTLLKELHRPVDEQMATIMKEVEHYKSGGGDVDMGRIKEQMKPLAQKSADIDSAFISEHPDSYIAFELFRKKIRGFIEPAILEPKFLHFSERIRHSSEGEKLAVHIAAAKKLEAGQPAIDFTLKDSAGQAISLSSLKGKSVLICFWKVGDYGSESLLLSMARVNKLYKDKGLKIVAVSYDEDAQKWAAAIRENKMDWINVSDKGGIDFKNNSLSTVAKAYDISYNSLPQCLLVGPDGKILASHLRVDNELPGKLEKQLGAPSMAGSGKEESDVYIGGNMVKYPQVDWIQGTPVAAFDKDRIYIVELWATWCVPCVAAMPHLNALSKKFGDKITVIGQDVMEEDKEKVVKFVQKKGDGLTYAIAYAGGSGSDFYKKWILPAGVTGIPQTFIIQNNKLVWQTHPDLLNEKVLQLLIDKKFTIEAAQALAEKN